MNTSDRIETLRKKQGISLTHLNTAIGAYRGKITDVRAGKSSFSEEEISLLAKELNTSTDYLLGNTDNPQPAGQPSSEGTGLNPQEQRLIEIFRELNEQGQEMVADYADTMLRSGKYKKYDKLSLDTKEA